MLIRYIHHSGFAVFGETASLLFDYSKGALPVFPTDKPLYVLVSHAHGDHYSRDIFSLSLRHPRVIYLLDEGIRGLVPTGIDWRAIRFLKTGESYSDEHLHVLTLTSNDMGLAFAVDLKQEKKSLYHAGDLNNWYWEGDEEDKALALLYHQQLKRLSGRCFDVAFIPLDPRLQKTEEGSGIPAAYLGICDFMARSDARVIVPMHQWGDYSLTERFLSSPWCAPFRDRVISIWKEGQTFTV